MAMIRATRKISFPSVPKPYSMLFPTANTMMHPMSFPVPCKPNVLFTSEDKDAHKYDPLLNTDVNASANAAFFTEKCPMCYFLSMYNLTCYFKDRDPSACFFKQKNV